MKGAFQTSREIFENPIWNDVPKFRIFFYIIGNAVFSHEGINKGGVHIGRGQYLRSYRNLRDDLEYIENRSIKKYSLSLIKRKVEQLVKEERLKVEDTELGTLFTVVNYALYQGLENYKSNNENAEETQREQTQNNNKNVNKDKNVKKNSRKHIYDDTHFELAEFFYNQILNNNPDHKKPNLEKWAHDIRVMMEQDNRNEKQVRYLIEWVQKDSFEMSNVLSPGKLRDRFDQLVLKVKKESGQTKTDKPSAPKESKAQREQREMIERVRRERQASG